MRQKYIVDKKAVQDFENEIGFTIESDYTIVLFDKKDGSVMGEVYNVFGNCLELDFNPEYDIQPQHIETFLQKFLENENDVVWNNHITHLSNLNIIDDSHSKWKERTAYIYLN
ncbi:hypothetical protein CQ046_11930 [Chryseobacterium sp. MYb7]|uniref:hypothetical protein n=1 Tax=Chryseobacterium sp. MYb7 TaxID=1827290 RepID=UPI000CFFABE2|nr:hypothetical protein [Chryseobacterium sp. MYb7]PRB02592.1 hypothetical protein CQ046_11930 [Chryseobacterium sp. MYb7]